MPRKKGLPRPLKKHFKFLFEEYESCILSFNQPSFLGSWYAEIQSGNLVLCPGMHHSEDYLRIRSSASSLPWETSDGFELAIVIAFIQNVDPYSIYHSYKFTDFKVLVSFLKKYYDEINNAFSPENLETTEKQLNAITEEQTRRILAEL